MFFVNIHVLNNIIISIKHKNAIRELNYAGEKKAF